MLLNILWCEDVSGDDVIIPIVNLMCASKRQESTRYNGIFIYWVLCEILQATGSCVALTTNRSSTSFHYLPWLCPIGNQNHAYTPRKILHNFVIGCLVWNSKNQSISHAARIHNCFKNASVSCTHISWTFLRKCSVNEMS